ncbi:transporter substrate-binding domain-containing protein [Peptoniphilus stercorisuis]|uniref:Lysine transport system substrate-binding protein n=1 Tax=Peptoniphilus stercorisuis TaxID=1436965 RepID=A0ABS4KDB8_9FIRM|nr:transporter substrate-binding domain-containing protein [Peptoniphilus stercorisuis]MBP2025769.1 putative lysine transport system substrate-binding protein [Peptoniphilus stercorisuis]
MKNLKKISVAILSMALMIPLVACGAKKEDENILKVGMEAGYPPYNWTQQDDSNGAVAIDGSKEYAGGYDVMIARKVAEELGKELVVVKTEWEGLPPAVQSGKIDLVMAGMSPTAQRREQIDFTEPYWASEYIMIVRKDGEYANAKSLEDFKGAKITGQLNTVHYDKVDQIEGVDKQEAMQDFPQMRIALQSGIIDGYVAEVPEGKSVEASMPDFAVVSFEEGKGFIIEDNENVIAAGVKKGSDLTEKVNQILEKITEEDRQNLMDEAIKNQPAID